MIELHSIRTRLIAILTATIIIFSLTLLTVPISVKGEAAQILVHRGEALGQLNCTLISDDWEDFPKYVESTTGTEVLFRHDGNNLYILVSMPVANPVAQDYWGIEFDNNNDQAHMGTSSSPDDSIFASPGCPINTARDAYLTGFAQPSYDDENGGSNDVTGLVSYDNGSYTIQIRRPLVTNDAAGYDVDLSIGTEILVGFVAGRFGQGAAHKGTDMSSYILSITNETSGGGGVVTLTPTNYMGLAASLGQILFFATLGLLVFHFFRRRAWRLRPYESKELEAAPLKLAEVQRHDGGMRLTHWVHVGLMTGLLITGWSIHDKSYFLGSTTTLVHLIFAFSIAFVDFPIHFLAMWRGGDLRHVFKPKKDDIKVAIGTTANFFYLSKKYPEHATWDEKEKKWYLDRKYCSYQKFLLYGDIIGILAIGVTGLALYWPENFQWLIALSGNPSNIRAFHLFIFYYFAASIMAHTYLSFIPSNIGRLKAMVTGKGKIRVHTEPEDTRLIVQTPGATMTNGGNGSLKE